MLIPCEDGGPEKSCGHGRHGETWFYAVRADDSLTALGLEVFTSRMPIAVMRSADLRDRWTQSWSNRGSLSYGTGYGAQLSLHAAPPLATDVHTDVCFALYRGDGEGPCQIIGQSWCAADTFWTAHAVLDEERARCQLDLNVQHGCTPDYFVQPESFWLALEERFRLWDHEARERARPAVKA